MYNVVRDKSVDLIFSIRWHVVFVSDTADTGC